MSVGWLLTHEIYKLWNPSVDTDPNYEGLANFVLSDQAALGGAGIGIGYVSINLSMTWCNYDSASSLK